MTDRRLPPNAFADRTLYLMACASYTALVTFRAEHGRWPCFLYGTMSRSGGPHGHGEAATWPQDARMQRRDIRRFARQNVELFEWKIPADMPEPVMPIWAGEGEPPSGMRWERMSEDGGVLYEA